MPRSKAASTPKIEAQAKKFRPKKKSKGELDIEERIVGAGRGELKEIVYVGDIVETTLKTEFGVILRALLKGRAALELAESRNKAEFSPDRFLGRLDAYEKIMQDLEQYVIDKDNALKTLNQDASRDTSEHYTASDLGAEINA